MALLGQDVLSQQWVWVAVPPFLAILLTCYLRWAAGEPLAESLPMAWADLLMAACVGYIVTFGQATLTGVSDAARLKRGGLYPDLIKLVQIRATRIDELQFYLFVFLLLSVLGGFIPAIVKSRSEPRSQSERRAVDRGVGVRRRLLLGILDAGDEGTQPDLGIGLLGEATCEPVTKNDRGSFGLRRELRPRCQRVWEWADVPQDG